MKEIGKASTSLDPYVSINKCVLHLSQYTFVSD